MEIIKVILTSLLSAAVLFLLAMLSNLGLQDILVYLMPASMMYQDYLDNVKFDISKLYL